MTRVRKAARRTACAGALALPLLGALASPASAGFLTPDSPASANADATQTIYIVMLIIATLLFLAIHVGLIGAIRRRRDDSETSPPRLSAGRGAHTVVVAALSALALAVFVVGVIATEATRDVPDEASALESSEAQSAQVGGVTPPPSDTGPLVIDVVGQQWLWRYEYPGETQADRTFSYERLVVPVDTTVILNVTSIDTMHRWYVPALGGAVDAVPGDVATTWFRAEEPGTWDGRSTQYSGAGYAQMIATVEAVPVAEYESYIEELAADIEAGREQVQEREPEDEGTETSGDEVTEGEE